MSRQCQHIKAGGRQCQGTAMWGSDPPRCPAHRQDGLPPAHLFQKGNRFGYLTATHGLYSRQLPPPQSVEDEAARLLDRQERLGTLLDLTPEPAQLLTLSWLYIRNLGRLVRLLDRYHETTRRHPDTLLRIANGRPKARYRAELARLAEEIMAERESVYAAAKKRAPHYWQIYEFIVDYIKRYRVGPTHREIKAACGINAGHLVDYWLDKLEQDGRITRRPRKHRGIRLAEAEDPQQRGNGTG